MTELLLDAAGRRRSPATMLGFHAGRSPRNKAIRHPAEARQSRRPSRSCAPARDGPHGFRLRGLIVVLWRAGLRIHEALALTESHLDRRRGSLLVCYSKGGRRREVGMDDWGWKHLQPRFDLRPRALDRLVVLRHQRPQPRAAMVSGGGAHPSAAGGRRRWRAATLAPHHVRHAHAVEMAHEGVPPIVIQPQLGHSKPRHYFDLPPGDRQRRDHRHRPRPPRPDHPGQRDAPALMRFPATARRRIAIARWHSAAPLRLPRSGSRRFAACLDPSGTLAVRADGLWKRRIVADAVSLNLSRQPNAVSCWRCSGDWPSAESVGSCLACSRPPCRS